MTKREQREADERLFDVYCGFLSVSGTFAEGERVALSYRFDGEGLGKLRHRYGLEEIAGKGSEFSRALRLNRWLAPNLAHASDFALVQDREGAQMNALSLLEYSFGKKEHGINCACKAKILVECCLSLGIFARRVGMNPASPYDTDSHVVAEIYDGKRGKWIMLDPTTGGYFWDGEPLSCLEMRERLGERKPCSVVLPRQRASDGTLMEKNVHWNGYYAKNAYYFTVDIVSGFGVRDARDAYLVPRGFDCRGQAVRKARYMLERAEKWGWEEPALKTLRRWAESARELSPIIGSTALWAAPDLY